MILPKIRSFKPVEVLYVHNSKPVIFTVKSDINSTLLCFWSTKDTFVIAPTDNLIVRDLISGRISARDSLIQSGYLWILRHDENQEVVDSDLEIIPISLFQYDLPYHGKKIVFDDDEFERTSI